LYDPVSYLAGWEHVGPTLTAHGRSALNEVLLRQHGLPPFTPIAPEQAQWVRRLLRDWEAIPAAAYLMACSLWRDRLAGQRLYQHLPAQAHAFMQFEFPRVRLPPGGPPVSPEALINWGGACIPQVLPELPSWLGRRIALRFAALPPRLPEPTLTPDDLIRFSMALAHAQKDPRFCRSLRP
jgi:hypothetical protein